MARKRKDGIHRMASDIPIPLYRRLQRVIGPYAEIISDAKVMRDALRLWVEMAEEKGLLNMPMFTRPEEDTPGNDEGVGPANFRKIEFAS